MPRRLPQGGPKLELCEASPRGWGEGPVGEEGGRFFLCSDAPERGPSGGSVSAGAGPRGGPIFLDGTPGSEHVQQIREE